jgi:hypothetical protein
MEAIQEKTKATTPAKKKLKFAWNKLKSPRGPDKKI